MKPPKQSATGLAFRTKIYVPLHGLIDLDKERERLNKEKEKVAMELERLSARLKDEVFLTRANPASVEKERERQTDLSGKMKLIEDRIRSLL